MGEGCILCCVFCTLECICITFSMKKKQNKTQRPAGAAWREWPEAPESRGPVVRSRQFQSRPPLTHSRTLAKWLASLGLGFSF